MFKLLLEDGLLAFLLLFVPLLKRVFVAFHEAGSGRDSDLGFFIRFRCLLLHWPFAELIKHTCALDELCIADLCETGDFVVCTATVKLVRCSTCNILWLLFSELGQVRNWRSFLWSQFFDRWFWLLLFLLFSLNLEFPGLG